MYAASAIGQVMRSPSISDRVGNRYGQFGPFPRSGRPSPWFAAAKKHPVKPSSSLRESHGNGLRFVVLGVAVCRALASKGDEVFLIWGLVVGYVCLLVCAVLWAIVERTHFAIGRRARALADTARPHADTQLVGEDPEQISPPMAVKVQGR
jgi:hypothetical protein